MATQKSIARRQRAFQEEMEVQMGETSSVLTQLLSEIEALKEELHETKLAVLRVERKFKEGDDEK